MEKYELKEIVEDATRTLLIIYLYILRIGLNGFANQI